MSHARIRSVTFKDGRAPIRVLRTKRHRELDEAQWNSLFQKHAITIADDPRQIAGYFMVAVFEDGGFNSASRVDFDRSPVPLSLWPAYVEEIARRKLVTENVVLAMRDDEDPQ